VSVESGIESPSNSSLNLSPGSKLKAARESLAFSYDDVCRELKTMVSQIKAIEDDRFGDLPGDAFVRGYIRGYAALVGLDADSLVAEYKLLRGEEAVLVGTDPVKRVVWPKYVAIVAMFMVIAAAVVWGAYQAYEYYSRVPAPVEVVAQEPGSEEFAAPDPVDESLTDELRETLDDGPKAFSEKLESIDLEGDATQRQDDESASSEAAMQVFAQESSVEVTPSEQIHEDGELSIDEGSLVPVVPEVRVIGSGRDELAFEFQSRSWVRVRDEVTFELLLNEIVEAPSSIRIRHTGKLDIRLGDARGVQVRFNGEPVSFRIRPDTNTAKIIVGE